MSTVNFDLAGIHLSVSWLNASLYMLEITLASYYFSRFTTRRPLLGILIGLLVAETVGMLAIFASTWMMLKGSPPSAFRCFVSVTVIMTTIAAVIEEVFLINRCLQLRIHPRPITWFLLAMVLAHAGLGAYSAIYVIMHPEVDNNFRRFNERAIAISACILTTVDILIPLTLSWQLWKVTPPSLSRKRSIQDSIVNSVSSGCCGGLLGLILIILFAIQIDGFYILGSIMGRAYGITVWVNLLVSERGKLQHHNPKGMSKAELSLMMPEETWSTNFSVTASVNDVDKELPPAPQTASDMQTAEPDEPSDAPSFP